MDENTTAPKPVGTKLSRYSALHNEELFQTLNEEMSFEEYIDLLHEKPKLCRNSFQYIYDMIVEPGVETFERYRKTYRRYKFFSEDPQSPIYGLEETLDDLVNFIKGAAGGYGTEHRVLLLHGPVGSSKSTICRIIKRGLENYSRTDAGAWYTYKWVNLPTEGEDFLYTNSVDECPMFQDPILLMEPNMRAKLIKDLNSVLKEQTPEEEQAEMYELSSEGGLNPRCRLFMQHLLKMHGGSWEKVVKEHIRVIRRTHSEVDRVGIGTFQPKDEKNQDSTELTGDMNFGKIGHFGADSDPRAFNFDGEFEVANRGMLEFIEALKLANEFLYDLLGASQEHQIKPKKFSQVQIDEMIIAHTNNPEYEKLRNNKHMEALRDRTIKVDVPYLLRWDDEKAVLEQDYGPDKVKQHIMPHTLDIASFFSVSTRLEVPEDEKLNIRDKVKLYNGKSLPGWTEDSVKELRDKYSSEGMFGGVSARYVQDKISNCLAKNHEYINVFMVLNELKEGLAESALITDVEQVRHYEFCIEEAKNELDDILKNEVQKALVADENAIVRLCAKYIDNVIAFVNKEKVTDPITGKNIDPNERLMRSIEEKIDVPEQGVDDFRRSIAAFIGTLANKGKEFQWDSNPELKQALQKKIFEDTKDHIKIATLSSESSVVDPDLQEKIDAIKTRLIDNHGYNDKSASDVLEYVSGIFARGDSDDD